MSAARALAKKNGARAFVHAGRRWAAFLSEKEPHPNADLFLAPFPDVSSDGVIVNQLARAVRVISLNADHIDHDVKKAALAAALSAIADALEALELPDRPPHWLRD